MRICKAYIRCFLSAKYRVRQCFTVMSKEILIVSLLKKKKKAKYSLTVRACPELSAALNQNLEDLSIQKWALISCGSFYSHNSLTIGTLVQE